MSDYIEYYINSLNNDLIISKEPISIYIFYLNKEKKTTKKKIHFINN